MTSPAPAAVTPSQPARPASSAPRWSDRRLKVLLSANTSWNLLNFRRPIIESLVAGGHEVVALAPRDDHSAALEGLGCRFAPLTMDAKGMSPFADALLFARLWRFFRRERPDAVLGYTIKNNLYGGAAARRLGVPFLPNVTGLGTMFASETLFSRLLWTLYRHAFGRSPTVFFQNRENMELALAKGAVTQSQARLLPGSGVDIAHFAPTPLPGDPARPAFLLIARLLWDKGVGEYAAAARAVRERHPGARFRLLGFHDESDPASVDRPTLDGWIADGVLEYVGQTDDVRPFISRSDCVILPSYYREGTPRSLLEAAAMGRPIITSDMPGCRDVVIDAASGFLCRPRDVTDLIDKIEAVIAAGPDGRARMGAQGRALIARDYDQRHVVEAYMRAVADLSSPAG
ncbi:MAG: glycosyltransferase family 4 protein [Caulobacterales bacterium]|nr:glycosyltransferase family 4 protein [Caulobacterales bacterium]